MIDRLSHCLPNAQQAFDERGEFVEWYLAGGVGNRFFWIGVGFEEDAIGAGGECGAGEGRHEFALAAADATGRARELHAMRGIHDGRVAVFGHDAEAAHVDHQVLIAKGGAALGLPDLVRTGFFELIRHEGHFVGREELAFFDVDRAIGFGGGDQ